MDWTDQIETPEGLMEWRKLLVQGVKHNLAKHKELVPVIQCVRSKDAKGVPKVIFVPCTAHPQEMRAKLRKLAVEQDIVAMSFFSESWMSKNVPKNYQYGDLAKASDRAECVMFIVETKHYQQNFMYELKRYANGNPYLGNEISFAGEDAKCESNLLNVLYRPERVDLN